MFVLCIQGCAEAIFEMNRYARYTLIPTVQETVTTIPVMYINVNITT